MSKEDTPSTQKEKPKRFVQNKILEALDNGEISKETAISWLNLSVRPAMTEKQDDFPTGNFEHVPYPTPPMDS